METVVIYEVTIVTDAWDFMLSKKVDRSFVPRLGDHVSFYSGLRDRAVEKVAIVEWGKEIEVSLARSEKDEIMLSDGGVVNTVKEMLSDGWMLRDVAGVLGEDLPRWVSESLNQGGCSKIDDLDPESREAFEHAIDKDD